MLSGFEVTRRLSVEGLDEGDGVPGAPLTSDSAGRVMRRVKEGRVALSGHHRPKPIPSEGEERECFGEPPAWKQS